MSFEYFKGDGSFIKNNYAIFREGLGGQDPNPIALDRGYEAIGGEMFMFLIPLFVWIAPEVKKSIKEIKDELSR